MNIKKTALTLMIAGLGIFAAPAVHAQTSKENCPAYPAKPAPNMGGMKIKKKDCYGVPEQKKPDRRDPEGGFLKKLFKKKHADRRAHHRQMKRAGKVARSRHVNFG